MARSEYTPVPISINQDVRVMALSTEPRLVYLSLRIGSDSHGRYRADRMPLRIVTGILDPSVDIETATKVLESHGLIRSWVAEDGQRFGEIVDYDDALTANMIKRRGASEIPPPTTHSRDSRETVVSKSRDSHEGGGRDAEPTHESGVSDSRDSQPPCARANLAEPSLTEPSPDIHTAGTPMHEDGPTLDDPCPHPARDGVHEVYSGGRVEGLHCRACGARPSAEDACLHPQIESHDDGSWGRCASCGVTVTPPAAPEPVDLSTEPPRVDPALSPPAVRWLEHRVAISREQGHAFASVAEADDLHGHTLRRLQRDPGFDECVTKHIARPAASWGKRLTSGIAYLERMVADWIPDKGNGDASAAQRHLCPPSLSVAEYKRKTGIDPAKAPVADDEMARTVMDALRVEA